MPNVCLGIFLCEDEKPTPATGARGRQRPEKGDDTIVQNCKQRAEGNEKEERD